MDIKKSTLRNTQQGKKFVFLTNNIPHFSPAIILGDILQKIASY